MMSGSTAQRTKFEWADRSETMEDALRLMYSAFDPDKRWHSDVDHTDACREAIEAARKALSN
jgi:hypothetical protein